MPILNRVLSWWHHRRIHTVSWGGRDRSYFLHVPAHLDPSAPAPLLLALHGATMNGPLMAWVTGLSRWADQAGYVVAYPQGTGPGSALFWNAVRCCGSARADNVDDVGFLDVVIADLVGSRAIDRSRVNVAGWSNGAMMAYRFAAERAEHVAAFAAIGGTLAIDDPRPSRPVPLLHIHGTEDEFVPYDGGQGPRSISGVNHRSVKETIETWVRVNGCPSEPKRDVKADQAGDGTTIIRETYGEEGSPAEVTMLTIKGGGHAWPGRPSPPGLGRSSRNLDANQTLGSFFARHRVANDRDVK